MSQTVKIDLNVLDSKGSLKARKRESDDLNASLETGRKLATGTRTGSQAAAAAFRGEGTEYGRARGSMGATGAGARDFANQAQGLGGLVRLYATYAANLFAVTAAFNALREAMNTTNMVEGLNQLGAASGVAMGNLAKQFTAVSGGAISLRESMEATAKAVSSGLSQAQFLKLGEVAKQASQALGINMSDAVSRLTRGITKLEPELLDELGIFTKVGKATEDYARSVGKAVTSLTDFERRQAFANAVLAEGAQKFGEISIPTNPYDKLLANLKNIGQQILELINRVLTPFVSLLSSSPTALTAVIGGLAALVVKQAIPAIGEYRAGLKSAAEDAKNFAEARAAAANEALKRVRLAKQQEIKAEKDALAEIRTAQVDAAEQRLKAVSKRNLSKSVQEILRKEDIFSITEKDIALLDKLGGKTTKVSAAYKELAEAIKAAQAANNSYLATEKELEKKLNKAPGMFSAAGIAAARAESARRSAASKQIISQASEDAAVEGFTAALSNLVTNIKTEKLGSVRGIFTGIAGAASAATTAITGILSVLSGFLGWIGVAIGVYQTLNGWLSKNSEETQKFADALGNTSEAAKAATATATKFQDAISIQSLLSKSAAFDSVADSLAGLTAQLEKADAKASRWDRLIDSLLIPFGEDLKSEFSRVVPEAVKAGLSSISDTALRAQTEKQLQSILGVKEFTEEAINSIDSSKIIDKFKEVQKVFDNVKKSSETALGPLRGIKDGFKDLNDNYTALVNTLKNEDPMAKFARSLASQSELLAEAFKSPISAVATLKDILEDTSKIRMFPPEAQASIISAAGEITKAYQEVLNAQKEIASARDLIKAGDTSKEGISKQTQEVLLRVRLEGEGKLAAATDRLTAANEKIAAIQAELGRATASAFASAFQKLEAPLVAAMAKGSVQIQKTLLDKLPKTAETARLQADLDIQMISIQRQQLSAIYEQVKSTDLLRLSNERLALEAKKASIEAAPNQDQITRREASRIGGEIEKIRATEQAVSSNTLASAVRSGKIAGTGDTLAMLQRELDFRTKVQDLVTQEQMARLNGIFAETEAKISGIQKEIQLRKQAVDLDEKQFVQSAEFLSSSIVLQQERVAEFKREQAELELSNQLLEKSKAIEIANIALQEAKIKGTPKLRDAAEKALEFSVKEYLNVYNTGIQAEKIRVTTQDRVNLQERLTQELERQKILQEIERTRQQGVVALQLSSLEYQDRELQLRSELGLVTEKDAQAQKFVLEQQRAQIALEEVLLDISRSRNDALSDWTKRFVANGQVLSDSLQQERDDILTNAQLRTDQAKADFDAKTRLLELDRYSNSEQVRLAKDYANVFKNSIDGLTDAFLEFAKTGKSSFKDLANSIISDLVRITLRAQLSNIFENMLGKGWQGTGGGWLSKLFNFGNSTGQLDNPFKGMSDSAVSSALAGLPGQAKGGVWNYGVQKFAKGGMFTNSIVDSPTLFKFAKGTGLMGEAGPEAIMPLKRDANGNLGVRAGGGNVEVVVNNYSTAQAETRETTDSRGNRRIEVVVGELVAGEVSRTGSQTQQAFMNTFGTRPALARR